MVVSTDWRIYLYTTDVTALCEWGATVEETLGQPGTASFVLQDRGMVDGPDYGQGYPQYNPALVLNGAGFPFDNLDVRVEIDGEPVPLFRGTILRDAVELPVQFPWRFHKVNATDYQREFFSRRLIGYPTGDTWSGPDSDGIYTPYDFRVYLQGSDKNVVADLMAACVPTIDYSTYVYEYVPDVAMALGIVAGDSPVDSSTVGGILDLLSGLAPGNVQDWLDPAHHLHHVALPRWWETLTLDSDAGLARMLPQSLNYLETAPVNIDNDAPDGIASIGCRNLSYEFDYSNSFYKAYINGGLGMSFNGGGGVDYGGTGWVYGDWGALSGGEVVIDASWSIDAATKQAAADRAGNAIKGGILRGRCTVGNERHHVDGWHVGQLVRISDVRLPSYLNGRAYVIQRVTTRLIPTVNWRVYDLEWGDAPTIRSSSRSRAKDKVELPGRLWDIGGRDMLPLPGTTVTVIGQLVNDLGIERRVAGIVVNLLLEVWDANGVLQEFPVGSISPTQVVTDAMGRWETQLTVGNEPGFKYKVTATEALGVP
jgi:hypothetical protein